MEKRKEMRRSLKFTREEGKLMGEKVTYHLKVERKRTRFKVGTWTDKGTYLRPLPSRLPTDR